MMKRPRLPNLARVSSRGAKRRGDLAFSHRAKALMIIVLILALIVPWSGLFGRQSSESASPASQIAQQEEEQKVQAEAQPEKIIPGPQNIKESTAIYVFLGWLWISIGVLIYILRLKIKEADRLHAIKFFTLGRK